MISRSVQREIARSSTGTLVGYRIGGGGGSDIASSGLIDGLLLLIAAVAQQALDQGCQCEGCAHWIQLNKDWGMEDIPYPEKGFRHRAVSEWSQPTRDE